jgi:hypothetical protein
MPSLLGSGVVGVLLGTDVVAVASGTETGISGDGVTVGVTGSGFGVSLDIAVEVTVESGATVQATTDIRTPRAMNRNTREISLETLCRSTSDHQIDYTTDWSIVWTYSTVQYAEWAWSAWI